MTELITIETLSAKIETDPLFSMLCQWIVEDTMENAGKGVKKTKSNNGNSGVKEVEKHIKDRTVKAKGIGQ